MIGKLLRRVLVTGIILLLISFTAYAQDNTLNVLVESGGFQLQEAAAALFTEETGVMVNFIQVPYTGVFERLSAEMAGGSTSFDVATIDVVWLPRFAQFAEPLDDLFTDDVTADLFPSLVADAQFEGHFVGMPTWANTEIVFYRKDLWEDPNEQAAFMDEYGYELAPPTTWQEFTDMAIFFTRDTDGDGEIDLYGTDVKGAPSGADVDWMVHVLQAGSPGVVLDADGNIIIDNEAHLAGLEFYVSHHCEYNATPPNVLEIDWGAAQNLFYQGQTAMMRFWGHAYRLTPEDSTVNGLVGVAPMIAGEAGIGAVPGPWYNIIPASSEKKDLAMQFVQFMYEHNALGIEAPLGLAARPSAYAEYADETGFESLNPLITTLSASQTLGRPLVADWQQISDEVVVPMVQDALSCEVSPADALAWGREQLEAMGYE